MNESCKACQWLSKHTLRLSAVAFFVLPGLAFAQQNDEDDQEIEEITVTGTATGTGIRGVAPVGSQVLDIARAELLDSPVRDAAEIITNLPQGSQIGSGIASADGGNDAGGSGLNLRGLGGNASLQLLDGHRMASQGVSEIGPDPSAIPFAAIERVEVVLDGASAIYGSDAVAGVVNYIMRDDFEGVDVQLSGRSGVFDSSKIEIVAGDRWGNFNVIFGGSFEDQGEMRTNERGYLMENLTPYGGNDHRFDTPTAGNTAVISVGGTDYGIPASFTGEVDPTTGLRRPTLVEIQGAPLNLADRGDYTYYTAATERTSAFLRANYEFSDTLQLKYTGLWSKREATNVSWNRVQVRINDDSPYYIPGLNPSGGQYFIHVSMPENGVPYVARPEVSTYNHYLDLRWDIGEWQVNGSAFFGRTHGVDINRPEANNAALTNDPAGTPEGYLNYAEFGNNPEWFNPYLTDADQPGFDNLVGHTWRLADQDTTGVNARIEGPVWELPGGDLRMSFGVERTDSNHWLGLPQTVRYYDKRLYWLRDTRIDRQVSSAFVEAYAPLIADMPGVQRLALSAAVRRDDYSYFGATTNPRFGLTWDVNDSLSFRGSLGEAFRAPTLTQMNPGVNSVLSRDNNFNVAAGLPVPQTDPVNNTSDIFTRSGRTPSLGPETAEMWSVGFDWTPVQIDGLSLQFTYYEVDYSNRIEALPNWQTALSSAANYAVYAPYIYPYDQPGNCVDGDIDTYSPILTQWLALEGTRFAGGPGDCQTVAVIDRGEQNVGSLFQKGIDYQIAYYWETDMGAWGASLNVAEILDLDRSLIAGGERFSILDRIGWQISRRANARVNWANESWNAALTARIEGSYLNDQTPTVNGVSLPDQKVGTWTTFDAIVAYRTPEDIGIWSGINLSLGAQNIADKQPPIVLHDDMAIDSDVHNPFGRMWRLEVGKRFE